MQSKQLALLSKLEQLGYECNTLRADLNSVLHEREGMSLVLTNLEQKCGQLQQQLMIEEVYNNLYNNICTYLGTHVCGKISIIKYAHDCQHRLFL